MRIVPDSRATPPTSREDGRTSQDQALRLVWSACIVHLPRLSGQADKPAFILSCSMLRHIPPPVIPQEFGKVIAWIIFILRLDQLEFRLPRKILRTAGATDKQFSCGGRAKGSPKQKGIVSYLVSIYSHKS